MHVDPISESTKLLGEIAKNTAADVLTANIPQKMTWIVSVKAQND